MNMLFVNFLPYLDTVLAIGLIIGGIFAVRGGKRNTLATIQEQTISALQNQITSLTLRIAELEKDNAHKDLVLETATDTLKQIGILMAVDGDMVILKNKDGAISALRKPKAKSPSP